MHIGIAIWDLCKAWGGAKGAGAQLANAMLNRGHQVTVFYHWDSKDIPVPLYPLDSGIRQCALNLKTAMKIAPTDPFLPQNREALLASGIDVFVALSSASRMMAYTCLLHTTGIPFVLSLHNSPIVTYSRLWNVDEYHACLTAADYIHILTQRNLEYLPKFILKRVRVIPNAIVPLPTVQHAEKKGKNNVLLTAGRFLDIEKQFSLLIEAFALLAPVFPDWKLVLCGDGKDMARYKQMISELGLADRVELPGFVKDMTPFYIGSDLFCIPSRFEGFGKVTMEANSFGLPAVGFAACPGTNEIIIHGENGLLAEEMTAKSLADQLATLMDDEALRHRLGKRAEELCSRYAPDTIYDQWEFLLRKAVACKGNTRLQKLVPPTDQEKALTRLWEILCRPTPGTPCNFRVIQKVSEERARYKRLSKKITKAWWYKLGDKLFKSFKRVGKLFRALQPGRNKIGDQNGNTQH